MLQMVAACAGWVARLPLQPSLLLNNGSLHAPRYRYKWQRLGHQTGIVLKFAIR